MKTLILPKFNLAAPIEDYEVIVRLDDKYTEPNDILCFIPNRQIMSRANQNLGFIPYGPNSWNYKQTSRAIGGQLGDDNYEMIDTDLTYPLHDMVGLNHNEELHIQLLTILFFLDNPALTTPLDMTLFEKVPMSEKEDLYLEQLITDKKIKCLQ